MKVKFIMSHFYQVDRSSVTFYGQPATSADIGKFVSAHIDSHKTNGREWPYDAEFCVVYATSTWPCGWDKEPYIKFFNNRGALDTWIAEQLDWATLEDNYVAFQAFEWDLGPRLLRDDCHNPFQIPSGLACVL